jgi:type IV pilus assembly protein PilQ
VKYLNLLTVTTIFLTAVPSVVASQKITNIELENNKEGLELRLESDKDKELPSFITVDKGNTLEATILNTELEIDSEQFQQTNPASGIEKITLERIDEEHTKITLVKESELTLASNIQQQDSELIVSFEPEETDTSLINKLPFSSEIKSLKNQVASLVTNKNKNDDEKEETKVSDNNQNNDVLVPNPEIIISNPSEGFNETSSENSYEQPYLPRAVAPPVGDMAVSNINASPDTVDLESSAIVPRLVLRDASVREVLSLLARQAGLNIVFTLGQGGAEGSEEGNVVAEGPTVSLDLENQTVQEAFDSILLISGLSASRRGNTIYIGNNLPIQARNVISRTIRLNQVQAANAALFLATQGAQGQRLTTEVEETVDPDSGRVVQRRELPASLEDLGGAAAEDAGNAFLLQGLLISTDDRLNTITLVGEARKVEIATSFLTQLDARRRQVAVNVKVIDINLLNQENFNSSFSFGVNDTYFQQDNGSAILNIGGENPTLGTTVTRRPRGNETTEFERLPDGNFREIEIPLPSNLPDRFLALIQSQVVSGNAKILTDPTLTVQEGQQATVRLVQDIVQSVETEIEGDSGIRTIAPVIGEAGLIVTVNVEQIDDNGFVSLSVSPSISSVGATQVFDSGAGAENVLNLLSTREVSSGLVRIKDGQTLILSGIIQDQERVAVTKVPILGDIPLLGSLFRNTDKSNERAEVIVLLTPEIIDEQADFGYNYQPSKDTREMLREGGLDLPNNPE